MSPVVLAFYALTATWLVLKYRYLINATKASSGIDWRLIGELTNAVCVGVALTVAPYLKVVDGNAWCPDIYVPPLATAALLIGVLAPLFDPCVLHPASSVLSSVLTCTYLGLGDCWGLGSVIAASGVVVVLIRVLAEEPETTLDEHMRQFLLRIKGHNQK